MSFELLSEPIRRYVRDQRWSELRPIQNAAISKILSTNENYILASKTASGKTEAAFLPILSTTDFNDPGVQVLYISPLKALINDQFYRVEELCKYLDITVTKWHGEAKRSGKEALLKNPTGIVLITPESIEAMFVNRPYQVKHLFSNLKFLVIDEIHSFIGTDRGVQLKSLISRIKNLAPQPIRIVGLSATIGDYAEAKKFTGDESNTKVLLDRSAKEIEAQFRYFPDSGSELPLELLKDLYLETKDSKTLVFPNSRGKTEEVAVKLSKISGRVKGHGNYFSHHSSVDKEVREYVEFFAKSSRSENFTIACTSTLELGIDIGAVDKVVQIDATGSVASLIQRIGRSGRRGEQKSKLVLYATNSWSLLQSLACWVLHEEGFIDPPDVTARPYDLLLHQALSISKEHSGIKARELIDRLEKNDAFPNIEREHILEIVNHLIETDLLEKIHDELIIGIEGEKVVNNRDFYSVFATEEDFQVMHTGNRIGSIPFSIQLVEGENIFLAARIWKIVYIDFEAKKILVMNAHDGKKPHFSGNQPNVHKSIREKMMEILFSTDKFEVLNEASSTELNKLRREFVVFNLSREGLERPLLIKDSSSQLFTFTGTKINRAIEAFFKIRGIEVDVKDPQTSFDIALPAAEVRTKLKYLVPNSVEIDDFIKGLLEKNPGILSFSKWGQYLPARFKLDLLKERYYDFSGAVELMNSVKLVNNLSSSNS